jgi:hypothetical protein
MRDTSDLRRREMAREREGLRQDKAHNQLNSLTAYPDANSAEGKRVPSSADTLSADEGSSDM